MAQDPYRYFRPEARNLLDQFAQGILELEKNGGSAGAVQRLLRLAHTLKGAARVVRQSAIAERAHAIEDALAPFRDCADGIARENIDAILAHLDEIGSQIVTLVPADGADGRQRQIRRRSANDERATDAATDAATDVAADTPRIIRADIADMDAVLDGVSETHARLNGLRRSAEAIEQVGPSGRFASRANCARHGAAGTRPRQPAMSIKRSRSPRSCAAKLGSLARDLDTAIAQMDRELRQLRDAAEGLAAGPGRQLCSRRSSARRAMPRARLSKQVTFEGTGGDIRLDADVLGDHPGRAHPDRPQCGGARHRTGERAACRRQAGRRARHRRRLPPRAENSVRMPRRRARHRSCRGAQGRGGARAAEPAASELHAEDLVRVLLRGGISTSAR